LAVDEMSTEWGNNWTTSDNAVMGEIGEGGCSSLLADMKNWSRETLDGDAAGAGNCQQHRYLTEKGVVSLLTVILERAAPTGQTPTETTIFASWNFIRAALYSNRPNYSLSLQCSNGGFSTAGSTAKRPVERRKFYCKHAAGRPSELAAAAALYGYRP